jgi:hypothetical protein
VDYSAEGKMTLLKKEADAMDKDRKSMMPGLVLAGVGIWLLSRNLTFHSLFWLKAYPVLLLSFAAALFWEYQRTRHHSSLFWGSVVLVIGLFCCIRNYRLMPYVFFDETWPVFLLALGIGFLVRFLVQPRDWGVLFPAGFFLFIGAESVVHSMEGEWAERMEQGMRYWPAALILLGIGLIASGMQKEK